MPYPPIRLVDERTLFDRCRQYIGAAAASGARAATPWRSDAGGSDEQVAGRAAERQLAVAVGGHVPTRHDVTRDRLQVAQAALHVVGLVEAAAAAGIGQKADRGLRQLDAKALVAAATGTKLEARHLAREHLVDRLPVRALVEQIPGVDHRARLGDAHMHARLLRERRMRERVVPYLHLIDESIECALRNAAGRRR